MIQGNRSFRFTLVTLCAVAMLVPCSLNAQRGGELSLRVTTPKSNNPVVKLTSLNSTTLAVMVRDELGEPISGLRPENFEIYRGKRKVDIIRVKENIRVRELSRRVVLLIDNSSSMYPRLNAVIQDLDSLLGSFGRNTAVAVVLFSDAPNALFEHEGKALPLKSMWFTTNKNQLMRYIGDEFLSKSLIGYTPLYDEVYAGYKILESSRLRRAEDVGIILSDGTDNASLVKSDELLSLNWGSTRFYTIDYLTWATNPFLQSLAEVTHGQYYQAGNISDLRKIFQTITEKMISGGYEIEFRFHEPPRATLRFYASSLGLLDTTSVRPEVDTLTIEEQIVRQQFPLLTYVFFDSGRTDIPLRYSLFSSPDEASSFRESSVPGGVLDRYYQVLNIIGARMRDNPKSAVTVTGFSDKEALDNAVPNVGLKRAQVVKSYFVSVWKIEPERVRVSGGGLPETPSAVVLPEGQAENRRVEIFSSDWEIMKPVVFELKEVSAHPQETEFNLEIYSPGGLKEWDLPIYSGGTMWYQFLGDRGPFVQLKWDWKDKAGNLPHSSLRYQLMLEDSSGEKVNVLSKTIPLKFLTIERKLVERLPEKDLEKVNLILFEFNSAVLGPRNERILGEVTERIKPESMVSVSGYTDIIGDEETNKVLSERRALSVAAKLSETTTTTKPISTFGYGKTAPLFSNDLPEGRFYNRTVQIVIETPR
jgi:outer membrane protein OmpA-like peptidoglycan-associated protein